jgi:hypothetical protein
MIKIKIPGDLTCLWFMERPSIGLNAPVRRARWPHRWKIRWRDKLCSRSPTITRSWPRCGSESGRRRDAESVVGHIGGAGRLWTFCAAARDQRFRVSSGRLSGPRGWRLGPRNLILLHSAQRRSAERRAGKEEHCGRLWHRSGPPRDQIKIENPKSPAMRRSRGGR